MKRFIIFIFAFALIFESFSQEQKITNSDIRQSVASSFSAIYQEIMQHPGRITVDSTALNDRKKSIELFAGLSLSYMPMREETVKRLYDSVRYYLPTDKKKFAI
ncbi:MAG TPA: hypothetical protein DEG28_11085, partial [Porphyromonadaceae bacterium]|nr:hypothetical protein [Porphyromonadaceae bacterium]